MSEEDIYAKMAKDLQISDSPFINILLLGETGVGKSTFINSIVNYLTYPDFEKATREDLITLISSQFTVQDKYGEYHEIKVGPEDDKNECLDVGMSATQDVKSYVFPIWNGAIRIRLIDTPGIGDGRGIDQDNINCEKILSYIGQLHELHAICYLFKPANSRITVYFDYCMTQILSRLEKSASRNMVFIFTNARGTDYTPGDCYPILKKVINNIKSRPPYVDIPLGKNMFCFDNEAFRYLAALKQNIEFNDRTSQRNCESWMVSVEQCNNLVEYIIGDSKNPPLQPHYVKNTNAINEARRLIIQLSRPLAEISQLISDNVFILQRHKEDLDMSSNTLDELKKKLYMPVIGLDVTELKQPVTVCTSTKCSEIYKVGEMSKWHYKQRCHDPCFLKNVPKEIIGSPELVYCAAINRSTKACIKCECDFSAHMHIYYLTKTVENKVVDKNILKNINNKKTLLENTQKLINNISIRKKELDKEHKIITQTCAKFAHFLQNNAITPFSDSYQEYIEYLITREKSLGKSVNKDAVDHLEKTLREYQEAKQFFDEALSLQKKTGNDTLITPQDIQENIQKLYSLKHNGEKIKELYECQTKSRTEEHKCKEYIHKALSIFSWREGKKKSTSSKIYNKQQKNTTESRYKKKDSSPSSGREELLLIGQDCPQDSQYQDNSETHLQDIPKSDNQATSSQIYNKQQKNTTESRYKKKDSSPSSGREELLLIGQDCPQDSQYQDNSETHLQDIPKSDNQAAHSQIDNHQMNTAEAERKISQSPPPPYDEIVSTTSQVNSQDSEEDTGFDEPQSHPKDIPGLSSEHLGNPEV